MIDRFISFSKEVSRYKITRGLISKWKLTHRKYEILNELKSITDFTKSNIYDYLWVFLYGFSRYDDISIPEYISIFLKDDKWRFNYDTKEFSFQLSPSIEKDAIDMTVSMIIDGSKKSYITTTDSINQTNEGVYEILKETLFYLVDETLSHMMKEMYKR